MPDRDWWRDAVVYQIYVRSFHDSDGDGVGDLPGITARLDHLEGLGVDALWLTPFFPSPLADGGYDVRDYRGVDPVYGDMDDFRTLVEAAHARGIRIIIDIVPNHCSDQHPWFQEALAAPPGSPERDRFVFRDGIGPDGSQPPSDWQSKFGGPAWEQVPDGQWYMHIFAREQPDLNWHNDEVRADFLRTLRFWCDAGVDGFRVDVAHGMFKDLEEPLRPTYGNDAAPLMSPPAGDDHPFWDRDEVHEIHREWRKLLDSYDPPRMAVAEAGVSLDRLPLYVRDDELHQAFNFFYLRCPWDARELRTTIDRSLAGLEGLRAAPSWVLSNHDQIRHRTRYGLPRDVDQNAWLHSGGTQPPVDDELGLRRARAAVLLTMALPGSAYVYQGEELGLPEVADLPGAALDDPMYHRSDGELKGRDGCRVPLPWEADRPGYGFGSAEPWLPQPALWGELAASEQNGEGSVLTLYRSAIALRRAHWVGAGDLEWHGDPEHPDLLRFTRGSLMCAVNLGTQPLPLPEGEPLLHSDPAHTGELGPDRAVWVDTAPR
ncbi:glycoside hydrolase family 13 protein [Nocardiopsis sp. HNM0947]|uniref:Glycoside hydrolase family 13 protein n=1 Tax=Nocardiopsis coralli TaxID=2772213 RepID=A0ABR9P752_9ACTN|nr:glycoside hydrolase family 13 protein [Nocardiopsis coralli]MBE2999644.1 glycoside hydrolase family 13 protein [Nocardiopsis coralli]